MLYLNSIIVGLPVFSCEFDLLIINPLNKHDFSMSPCKLWVSQAINSKILRLLLKASSPTVFSSVSSICLSSIFLAHILSESQGSFERFSSLFSVTKHLSCPPRYLERWLNVRISKSIYSFKPVAQLSQ